MIPQRIADYLRELRIARLGRQLASLIQQRRTAEARAVQAEWLAELNARSPEQVARMERAMGLQPRRALKGAVITAYCWGLLPAFVVAGLFRAFRLRGA